ncbi:MAG TPA: hypothetical protein PKD37_02020 [Oligoflexia bacterium]|mgnify:CR=1 FL=1|nr:hypothetical protein [Oligoflexia bacterium]HMP26753.1 hypothetical protein [Oligoflexia bacterium]
MAIDPSLTCSGWALFNLAYGELLPDHLLGVGKIKALPAKYPMARRLSVLQTQIADLYQQLSLGSYDIIIVEAPTTMRDPRAALAVEQVRCLFEAEARSLSVVVPGRINPRSVQKDVLGMIGKQPPRALVKESARVTVRNLFGNQLKRIGFEESLDKNQDIVDALLVGVGARAKIISALQAGIAIEDIFEQKKRTARTVYYKQAF